MQLAKDVPDLGAFSATSRLDACFHTVLSVYASGLRRDFVPTSGNATVAELEYLYFDRPSDSVSLAGKIVDATLLLQVRILHAHTAL